MALNRDNRAVQRWMAWLREEGFRVELCSYDENRRDGVPVWVVLADTTHLPLHTITLRLEYAGEGETVAPYEELRGRHPPSGPGSTH
jgi:hypothetical protein